MRAGVVDDERLARSRAAALAARGYGDAAIEFDLKRQGLPAEIVELVLAELEPERERAARVVASRSSARPSSQKRATASSALRLHWRV